MFRFATLISRDGALAPVAYCRTDWRPGDVLGPCAFARSDWKSGDVIPQRAGRSLRVVAVIPRELSGVVPMLVVEPAGGGRASPGVGPVRRHA